MKIIRNKKDIIVINDKDGINSVFGTSLQGSMLLPYEKIVEKLGKPTSKGDNYKVSAKWEIITPYGMATIYDYKTSKKYCGKEGVSAKENTDWHIGGHNKESANVIIDLFFK